MTRDATKHVSKYLYRRWSANVELHPSDISDHESRLSDLKSKFMSTSFSIKPDLDGFSSNRDGIEYQKRTKWSDAQTPY